MSSLAIYSGAAFTVSGSNVVLAPLASVRVMREDTGALASIFSDRAGASPLSNPMTADAYGRFSFYAAGLAQGYRIRVTEATSPGLEYELRNQEVGTFGELDNPITTAGDLIIGGGSGVMTRKAIGTDGYRFTPSSGASDKSAYTPPSLGFNLVGGYLDWTTIGSPTSTLSVAIKAWSGNDPSDTEPVFIAFRSATAGTGTTTYRKINAPTSITINDTALLGATSNVALRLWCVAFDDSGTIRLAVINCLATSAGTGAGRNVTSIFPLAGWGIASSTLEDNASDSAQVFYSSGAGVSAKAYSTLGYATWEAGLPNAGNWNANPTRIQLYGPGVPLPGQEIQRAASFDGAAANGSTTIPYDDTIPQNTEGVQFMSQAITPISSANVLDVEHHGNYADSNASNAYMQAALFQDATANALATSVTARVASADALAGLGLRHTILAGTTSATTFKIRAGVSTAGTVYFNSDSGGRRFGGVMASRLVIRELMA